MNNKNKRKQLPPTFLFLSLLIMVGCHFICPVDEIIPFPWNLTGLLLLLAGIILNLIADNAFKKFNTTVKPFEESSFLVTNGAFKICRHPMYLGMVFILLGLAVLLGSLTVYIVIPAFAFIMDCLFIRIEEKMLEDKFGLFWKSYRKKVRRWI